MALRHQPMDKDDWLRIIRRADLTFTTKGIAVYLSIFAEKDGSRVRPGEERMAAELELTTRCVREHLEILRAAGLIERVNRGTAVRGRADVYQLTVPGPGHAPVPMRLDPDGNRLTPVRPVRKRAKKAAAEPVPEPAEQDPVTGTAVPETGEVTGTGVPVDNGITGTGVPVDETAYRNPGAGNVIWLATTYRNPGSDLPEPLSTVTGTGVPPTTHTTHDHPSTGSPNAGTSLAGPTADGDDNPGKVDQEAGVAVDVEFQAARDVLAACTPYAAACWRRAAQAELQAAGIPLDKRAVTIRAADLATRPGSHGAA